MQMSNQMKIDHDYRAKDQEVLTKYMIDLAESFCRSVRTKNQRHTAKVI